MAGGAGEIDLAGLVHLRRNGGEYARPVGFHGGDSHPVLLKSLGTAYWAKCQMLHNPLRRESPRLNNESPRCVPRSNSLPGRAASAIHWSVPTLPYHCTS